MTYPVMILAINTQFYCKLLQTVLSTHVKLGLLFVCIRMSVYVHGYSSTAPQAYKRYQHLQNNKMEENKDGNFPETAVFRSVA